MADLEFIKWGLEKGALVAIIVLLLQYIKKRDQDLSTLLAANTAAFNKYAESNMAMTEAMKAQTNAMQVLLYGIKRRKTKPGALSEVEEAS